MPSLSPITIRRRDGGNLARRIRWIWPGAVCALGLSVTTASAEVRLSEFMAATNDRLVAEDAQGRVRPGSGLHWTDVGFAHPGWRRGTAPLGFGGPSGLGTNVSALMRNRTPVLYLRRSFTLTAQEAANLGRLRLQLRFDDGCVAWINGREAGRANAGPSGHFVFHDQPAYNFSASVDDPRYSPRQQPGTSALQPEILDLGPARDWLRPGENVLALQLLNRDPDVSARIDASLEVVAGAVTIEMMHDDFSTSNGARLVHRNFGGAGQNELEGAPPAASWLALAPGPQSTSSGPEFQLAATLDPAAGLRGGGALRIVHEQSAGAAVTARWFGPPVARPPELAGAAWSAAELAATTLRFKFRASPETAYSLALVPFPGADESALEGLPPLTATAGTAAAEALPDSFADAVGGVRTLTVNGAGAVVGGIVGTVRNSYTLSVGPAMRDFGFQVVEDPAPGTGTAAGHVRCEVTRTASAGDSFGFTLQTFLVRSWTAGAVTPDQLAAVVLQVEARVAAGVPLRIWLEPASAGATASNRLDLGVLTGTGAWRNHALDVASGSNQTAFLAALNAQPTALVRIGFRSDAPLPVGTAWQLDTIGFVPWRTYSAPLASATNTEAFLNAVNGQAPVRFFAAWEKSGTAVTPARADLVIDDFALATTLENAGTARTLVPWSAPNWDYWPGLAEPSGGLVEPADFNVPTAEPGYADWIEIENTGPTAAPLTGWSLTTRRDLPRQWVFPAGTTVPAGGRLVVLADGRSASPAGASWLHASFTLPAGGGYLALVDASGALRDAFDPAYPPQGPLHSFGRSAHGAWGFLRSASPGAPNDGPWFPAATAPVVVTPRGGFHSGPVTVTFHCATPGARLRYTLDGTEPTPANGFEYTGPITLNPINDKTGHPLRARALADGLVPSPVATETYLIDQHAGLRSAPAIALTGDPGTTFYRPQGVLAVQGGTFDDELWVPLQSDDYHMPMAHGRLLDADAPQRPYERPAQLEFLPDDGQEPLNEAIGLRVASSPYSRPRLRLDQAATASPLPADPTEKPSFNLFFRDDIGAAAVTYPLIPATTVRRFEELRLRAGKNDIRDPFIRDEFIRRLFTDMGQVGSVGGFHGLWINGAYKGYFNLCERIREPFLQNHYPGSGEWDVDAIFQFEDGDSEHFGTIFYNRLTADLDVRSRYEALTEVFDLTNAADYYLLMVYAAMWDWPDNNWVMARERSPAGRWRCYVWDAEGAFGLDGHKPATWNSFANDLLPQDFWICFQFQQLMRSEEWRLLFADRIQRHFFNGGALTDSRLTARQTATAAEVRPFLAHAGITPDTTWFTNWLNANTGRKHTLFPHLLPGQNGYTHGHFRDPDGDGSLNDTLWPLTLAPTLSLTPGAVPAGATLTLGLAAGVPAGSTVWYTVDGTDPRAWGGATSPGARAATSPLPLAGSIVIVRARARHATTGEWSPLTEAVYRVGTVPASSANLAVTQIMYHPPAPSEAERAEGFADPDDFEFLEIRALGPAPVDLTGVRFSDGITFDFSTAARTVLDPGVPALLVRNRDAVIRRYGAAVAPHIIGEYFGGLNNGGEGLRLESASGTPIKAFAYGDDEPWPAGADGGGASLVLINPAANPDPGQPAHWTASAAYGGQPGGVAWALGYEAWGQRTFPPAVWASASLAGPFADADADGWPNALEYLLLGAPTDPSRFPDVTWERTQGADGPRLVVSLRLAPGAMGFSVTPEGTGALAGGSWRADFIAAPDQTDPDGAVRKSWFLSLPPAAAAWYGRLRLARVP